MCVSFPDGSAGKESACSAGITGNAGSIPELGRFPGGGHGNSLQHFCLEDPMDRGAWRAAVRGVTKAADSTEAPEHACMYVCMSPGELVVFL